MEASSGLSGTSIASILRNYNLTDQKDLQNIADHPDLTEKVKNLEKNFFPKDVLTYTENWARVGKLLPIAYAGSKALPCHLLVLGIFMDCLSFFQKSEAETNKFVNKCLKAIKQYKLAELCVKDQPQDALQKVSKCSLLAKKMRKKAEKLAEKSEILCEKTSIALMEICGSYVEKAKRLQEEQTEVAQVRVEQRGTSTRDPLAPLDTTSKTIVRIKAIFDDVRLYWRSVASHCRELTGEKHLIMSLKIDEKFFQEALMKRVLLWMTFGKINLNLLKKLKEINHDLNVTMGNLPITKKDAMQFIQRVSMSESESELSDRNSG